MADNHSLLHRHKSTPVVHAPQRPIQCTRDLTTCLKHRVSSCLLGAFQTYLLMPRTAQASQSPACVIDMGSTAQASQSPACIMDMGSTAQASQSPACIVDMESLHAEAEEEEQPTILGCNRGDTVICHARASRGPCKDMTKGPCLETQGPCLETEGPCEETEGPCEETEGPC